MTTMKMPSGGIATVKTLSLLLGVRRKTLWWLVLTNKATATNPCGSQYRELRIPKKGGGYRVLHDPSPRLKFVQKLLLARLFAQRDDTTPGHVGAYVIGRGIAHTVTQHVAPRVLVSMDVSNFFPSTKQRMVKAHLESLGFSGRALDVVTSLVCVNVWDPGRGRCRTFLPQGAPTSAALSNAIAMASVDAPLMARLSALPGPSFVYTRYCDNLELSTSDPDATPEHTAAAMAAVREVLSSAGYSVNDRKTKVAWSNSPRIAQRVLGVTVNSHPNIPSREYRRLKTLVHLISVHGLSEVASHGRLAQPYVAGVEAASAPGALYASLHGELVYWAQIAPKAGQLLTALKTKAKT